MPLVQTRGAASAQGFGEFAQATAVNYIEEVFSTFLYTGTGATQTITNGIDLSTKGGLVWTKSRSNAEIHGLFDTNRGVNNLLQSASANQANTSFSNLLTSFNSNGFTAGADTTLAAINSNGMTYVSWTFREQPKFFDVVSWTGTGANTTIAHSLGSVPGSIWVKRTDAYSDWQVYHRSLANTEYLVLNTTAAQATGATRWNSTTPTSTVFSLGTDATVNDSGGTYVAYLFAHDAGGFGLLGTDNVISCGSFTVSSSTGTATLGYEPQFVLIKRINSSFGTGRWYISDSMRGGLRSNVASDEALLFPNLTNAEQNTSGGPFISCFATGFTVSGASNDTYIYIAIRRGPMKVPTVGTSVFKPVTYTGSSGNQSITGVGFPPDLFMANWRANTKGNFEDRLRGTAPYLQSTETAAEASNATNIVSYDMSGITLGVNNLNNKDGASFIGYFYQRAPSFFDQVCYTGTNVAGNTINHNLTVAPELIIIKRRATLGTDWDVSTLFGATTYTRLYLNTNDALYLGTPQTYGVGGVPLYSKPTATQLQFGVNSYVNASDTYVAYLFATCAGVSKVGSYTGTGTTLQINCGFTAGARFVLIKRTDSTGDWYVWDSARGIVAGDDPYFLLNSTAAEVTNTDYVDTYNAGFEITSTAPAAINASAGTFIFLAIA